ncbi:MAG: tRNA 2-thiouridine(34) synthase MnmA [Propionibacterium sp.]|nr:MAG: tRNA 2-thiouridine(34) synthase MnmA [Propionibacterium sp.]
MRVLVALSGGVDSAVTAARLVAAGHQVSAVYLALNKFEENDSVDAKGCGSLADSRDAALVAEKLGIDFEVWDFSKQFQTEVVDDFLSEYRAGRTPNPCLRCNKTIKFAALLEHAIERGFDKIATGHYAKLVHSEGITQLWRADDKGKDQSYVLGVLSQEQLRHCLFPLNDTVKTQVRREAAHLKLGVANKPDSTDICFIPGGGTADYLNQYLGNKEGEIVDTSGMCVGRHDGYHQFTIGQRKGLHLGVPAADGRPRYVLDIEPVSNTVIVGSKNQLGVVAFSCIRPSWTEKQLFGSWRGQVQIRAHGAALPATISTDSGDIRVTLDNPERGVAPGQSAVFYDADRVLGAATISKTERVSA